MRRVLFSGMILFVIFMFVSKVGAMPITIESCSVWDNPRTIWGNYPPEAIDGNTETFTWSTQPFNTVPNYIGLDFGISTNVNRIRLWKDNADGAGGEEWKNLTILFTVDDHNINLEDRLFVNVSGLVNGYNGTELMDALSVNTNGTVTHDDHDSVNEGEGWASLTFNAVEATGVAIYFTNTGSSWHHYKVHEFEAHGDPNPPVPEPTTMLLLGSGLIGLAGFRRKFRKN